MSRALIFPFILEPIGNLSDSSYTCTAYYYDMKGRVVQHRSVYDSCRYTATSSEYLFNGSIAQQLTIQGTDSSFVREHYHYTYDHAGRPKKVFYQLNNNAEICLSAFSYDSLGRVAQKLLHNNKDAVRYSYDMRNMLTETRNKHFSERLYYADSVFQVQHATHCYNGNIAASRITFRDSIFAFIYAYDALNRLTSSKQPNLKGDIPCELLQYDAAGNITSLKRYQGRREIDNLSYWYGEEGSQVISITDAGNGLSKYATIEYHNSDTQADTIMRYDANGNLIVDIDRHINAIHYNILNLPDTIQFDNGNQIVNLYNAAGQKYKTIVYTVPVSTYVPQYEILHYTFNTEGISYSVTEYSGNIERHYVLGDTTLRIHNAIGYYVDNAYFHYIHDHLGNVCAVVQSDRDSVIQSTMYYASGVPMARSFGRDKQPYLYNGKEFVEAHEWNTYDYGFRGYYATIGRFTCVDPLAEQTPWLSPYAYAGNNFTNAIDWMGLSGFTQSTMHWVAVDENYIVLDFDLNSPDQGVYLVDDENWDGTYWDLLRYRLLGIQKPDFDYRKGSVGEFDSSGKGYYNGILESYILYDVIVKPNKSIIDDILTNPIFEDNIATITSLLENINAHPELVKYLSRLSKALGVAHGLDIYNRYQSKGWTPDIIMDTAELIISLISDDPETLATLLIIDIYRKGGDIFMQLYDALNSHNYEYWVDWSQNGK